MAPSILRRSAGSCIAPVRFNCTPEITLYQLRRSDQKAERESSAQKHDESNCRRRNEDGREISFARSEWRLSLLLRADIWRRKRRTGQCGSACRLHASFLHDGNTRRQPSSHRPSGLNLNSIASGSSLPRSRRSWGGGRVKEKALSDTKLPCRRPSVEVI